MSSLIKFMQQNGAATNISRSEQSLHWGRASSDGLPFRGNSAPLLRDDEYEDRVVRVADAKNGTFFTGDPEQNLRYLLILDRVANGWYQILHIDRWRDTNSNNHFVYVEWLEFFMEDGKPTQPQQAR